MSENGGGVSSWSEDEGGDGEGSPTGSLGEAMAAMASAWRRAVVVSLALDFFALKGRGRGTGGGGGAWLWLADDVILVEDLYGCGKGRGKIS